MLLTPRAEMLQEPLQLWLRQGASSYFRTSFDPAVAQNQFRIAASDYVLSSFLDFLFVQSLKASCERTLCSSCAGSTCSSTACVGEVDLVYVGG